MRRVRLLQLSVLAVAPLLVACADDPTAPEPPSARASAPTGGPASHAGTIATQTTTAACQTIDFDGYAHGDLVSALTVHGTPLTVAAVEFIGNSQVATSGRAYDTDNVLAGGDTDLEHASVGARCPGCDGLGRVLVVQDINGPIPMDAIQGGSLTFTGFNGGAHNLYIRSFTAVDVDDNEHPMRFFVDGVQVGQAQPLGDGSVQTVVLASTPNVTSSIAFVFGTPEDDGVTGSGAIDNIEVCIRGGEGCTLGYWKQEHHFDSWVGYTPAQALNTVFTFPAVFAALGTDSFLTALEYKGGPDAIAGARLLLKQAVPALLNASAVGYALSTAEIVSQVNDAMATGDRATMLALATQLDTFNNAGCPLN